MAETQTTAKDKLAELLQIGEESDENIKNLTAELTNSLNIETKSNISRADVVRITKAISYARRYGVKSLDVYTRKVMLRVLVSVDRGGRNDIRDALASVFQWNINKQQGQNVKV